MQSIIADSFDTTSLLGSQLGLSVLLPVTTTEQPELTLTTTTTSLPSTIPLMVKYLS